MSKLPADVASKVKKLKEVSTALWIDTNEAIPRVSKHLQEAAQKQKSSGKAQVIPIVVYNLPLRDCAAAASAGQFTEANMDPYKKYIDSIVQEIQKVPDLSVVVIVEPDSLPNLVTNINQAKCAKAKPVYMEGVAYAVKSLQLPNVAIYLDIAHAGWLGWDSARAPTAKVYAEVMKMAAPAKIRGFATNVANYNVVKATVDDPIAKDTKIKDEASFVQAMSQELQAVGLPTNFIIDTSRSGTEKSRTVWGNWCNIKKAGLGPLPQANPGIPNVDAFVWVKPPGESDGVSDASATRYDQTCTSDDSFTPSPQAGVFNPGHFAAMVKLANPPL
jgi:cellulose 1,4-beta-cellobiosidase